MAKRKYEVVHKIRIERRKVVKIGAVLELDAGRAHEWRHALRALPEDEQTSTQQQAPQEEPTSQGAATEDGAEASEDSGEAEAGIHASEGGTVDASETDAAGAETFAYQGAPRITKAAAAEAERRGIDLSHVRATGVGNTLTKADVQREAKRVREERQAES